MLPVVRTVEQHISYDLTLNHEYLPVLGILEFTNAAVRLALGADSSAVVNSLAFGVQTLSSTGAIKIGLDFLSQNGYKHFYTPDPSLACYEVIAQHCGLAVRRYRYYDLLNKTSKIYFIFCQ